MLLLTRFVGQSIIIGDTIRVRVRRVNGMQVKISIEAPDEVNIVRKELDPEHPALKQYPLINGGA